MATFTWSVDVATQAKTDAALVKTQYGDGYMQRRAAGIHALRRTYSVQVNSDTATIDAVEAFLRANAIIGFDWTPPTGAAAVWTCDGWTRGWDSAAGGSITADFVEWFA